MSQNNEQSMRCPFDPAHVMPYSRFLNHLDKCKFPDKHNYHKCRFNPYHVIHIDQIDSHEKKCPDRAKYQPIQDDKDDWWGVEEAPKPQKSTVSTSITNNSKNQGKAGKQQEMKRQQVNKRGHKGKVQIQDFDQADYSQRQK